MISMNRLLWTILPSDWLIYSLIGDRPLVANFKFKTMAGNTFKTMAGNTFKTMAENTFKTMAENTFKTMAGNSSFLQLDYLFIDRLGVVV